MQFFQDETLFIENWKRSFKPNVINDSYLRIFFIPQASQSLIGLCSHTLKENVHYLSFKELKLAKIAYDALSVYNLNWTKKLNGKIIEIVVYGHSHETRENLQKILNQFLNQQKNSWQAKRNKLLKSNKDNKQKIDEELKILNQLIKLTMVSIHQT